MGTGRKRAGNGQRTPANGHAARESGTRHCRTPRPGVGPCPEIRSAGGRLGGGKRTGGQQVCTIYLPAPPNPGTTMFRDRAKDCLTGQEEIPIVNYITCDRRPLPPTYERRKTVRRGDHSSSRHRRRSRSDSPSPCLSRSRGRVPAASVGHPGHIHGTHRPPAAHPRCGSGVLPPARPDLGLLRRVDSRHGAGQRWTAGRHRYPGAPGRRGHHGPGRRDPAVPQSLLTGKHRRTRPGQWPWRVPPEFIK